MGAAESTDANSSPARKKLYAKNNKIVFYSLLLRYGGKFAGSTSCIYLGGDYDLYDFVNLKKNAKLERLDLFCENLGLKGQKSYCSIVDNKKVYFKTNRELLAWAREPDRHKFFEICVETGVEKPVNLNVSESVVEEVVNLNADESVPVVEKGESSKANDSVPVVEEGKMLDVNESGDSGDDSQDSDFVLKEVSGDDSEDEVYVEDDSEWHEAVDEEVEGDTDEEPDEDLIPNDCEDYDANKVSDDDNEIKENPKFDRKVIFNPDFVLAMEFENKELFKEAITSHAINTKRSLYLKKNDKRRVYARCKADVEGCDWHCHALKVLGHETYQIRKYNPTHTCAPTFHVSNMSSTWLGKRHLAQFQCDPKRDVRGWRKEVIQELHVDVSKQMAYRARKAALQIIQGEPDIQYNKLWDYCEELKTSNPGTTTVLDIDDTGKFSKLYVCFSACKSGFKKCRPFIGVDGCWLKGARGGILLSAVGVDPGNALFPIAFAVVSVESRETWQWFLINLKHDLDMMNTGDYTFMSDKQKGLIAAMSDIFPDAEHRFCVRHMHANMVSAGFRGEGFRKALFRVAYATTMGTFTEAMKKIRKLNEAAAEWVGDKDPRQWSLSHFRVNSKCALLLNNGCESFNAAIMDARDQPILTMLEWLRQYLMERFQKNREKALKWNGILTPAAENLLEQTMETVSICIPIKSDKWHYQIQCSGTEQFAVDLQKWTCSCRVWELTGVPCNHALAAILKEGENPQNFVHECYKVSTYRDVYADSILPIKGQVEWYETLYIPPMPPNFGKSKRGRQQRLRRRDITEEKKTGKRSEKRSMPVVALKRQKRILKCSKCGVEGHTRNRCKTNVEAEVDPGVPAEMADELFEEVVRQAEAHESDNSHFPDVAAVEDDTQGVPTQESVISSFSDVAVVEDGIQEVPTQESVIRPPQTNQKIEVRRTKSSIRAVLRSQRGRGRGTTNSDRVQTEFEGVSTQESVAEVPPQVRRTKASIRAVLMERGRGRATSGSTRRLVDEDNTQFEALLDQFNSGGEDIVPSLQRPSCWDQLKGTTTMATTSTSNVPKYPTMPLTGYKPMFTSQSRAEASKKQIFMTGNDKTK